MSVEGRQVPLLIDSGLTHEDGLVGVSLDETNFRAIRSRLRDIRAMEVTSRSGVSGVTESGLARVSIIGLDDSEVETRVVSGGANLLGVSYLHRLTEFSVFWDLSGQLIIITRTGEVDD